jgi:hypothetical protein
MHVIDVVKQATELINVRLTQSISPMNGAQGVEIWVKIVLNVHS